MLKWIVVAGFLVVSYVLTHLIPYSSFFRNVNTMIHELGHALTALLTSGRVFRIELNADHSGVTYTAVTSGWSAAIVSLAGYTLASCFAVAMFYAHYRKLERSGLIAISAIAAVMLILFVHEGFGVGWLIGFALLNVVMLLLGATVRRLYFLLIAFLTLEESVWSTVDLLLLAMSDPSTAGDAANLARLTGIPALAWAVLFLVFALWCAQRAIRYLFHSMRERVQMLEQGRSVPR